MMKRMTTMIAVVLLFSLLLSSCGLAAPRAATEAAAEDEEKSEALLSELDAPLEEVSLPPLEVSAPQTEPTKVKNTLFRAKFEGSTVAGSGEAVDGVYRFNATKTDGESWHIKLEANYPTVAGRDYRVTYRFHSDVAGKIKFGDFQEFEIQKGDNSVTGILIADSGTSYLDLQLGMLRPFTIDFNEIEVEEYADEEDYEEALTSPVNFEKEKLVFEKHDQGYAPVLTRGRNAVSINYLATSWEPGVWKSRLYVKTGLFPESGVRYHLAVDVTCDEDMPFEILFNDGEIEKGYGALYGQNVAAGEVTHCEAVITGTGAGEDLVMQFSLGEAPEGSTVKIGNLRIEKIRDHYNNMLPSTFALNEDIAIGTYKKLVPVDFSNIPLSSFSYSSTDSAFEGHDDGYLVRMNEAADSVTMDIYQAPAAASDRGVWKAKLYVDTGAALEAGQTYKVDFDLVPERNQGEYEVCFDSDSKENAYGALYGRSLTAGTADHISYVITPTEDNGKLVLRLQLGKTDSAEGNKYTFRNLSIESLPVSYSDILPADFSYNTPAESQPDDDSKYISILPDTFSYRTGVNVTEWHNDGYTQSVSADGSSATLDITGAPASGREGWRSKLMINTGVTPQPGAKYQVSFDVNSEKDQSTYDICFDGYSEKDYGALYGKSLEAGSNSVSYSFLPAESKGPLTLQLQLGITNDETGNTVTVSNLKIAKLTSEAGTSVLPADFAYPVSEGPGYRPINLSSISSRESHDGGYEQTKSNNNTLTISSVPRTGTEVWKSKLFIDTGTALDAGATYRVTANVTSEKAFPFEICYNNGEVEKGYSTLYGQMSAGTADYVSDEFTVPADATTNKLILQFSLGKSPAPNAITVNSVSLEQITSTPDQVSQLTIPAGFQRDTLSGMAGSETQSGGYTQTLTGSALTINAVPSDANPASSSLFVNTNTVLAPGKHKVIVSITTEQAVDFDLLFNHGSNERSFGEIQAQSLAAGETRDFEQEIISDTNTSTDPLIIQLHLGVSPEGNTVTVNSVTLEREVPERQETVTTRGGVTSEALDVHLTANEWHADGYQQTLGTSLTITEVSTDPSDWKSKLFFDTDATLEAGVTYKLTTSVTSTSDINNFCVVYSNTGTGDWPDDRKYDGKYEQSIAANQTKIIEHEWTVNGDTDPKGLHFTFQLGNSPAGTVFTVNSVTLEKYYAESSVDPASFELWTHEGYSAALGGDGSSAKVTFTNSPDSGSEVWKTKLFAKTGVMLEAGKLYRISADVQATSELGYEICYNNGGTEKGVGAKYGLTAGSTLQTVTYEVTPATNANLIIQFSLGNAAAGNEVTVSNIKVEEVKGTPGENLMTDSLVAWAPVHNWSDAGYVTTLSNNDSSATLNVNAVASEKADWKMKLYVETGAAMNAGKTYRIRYKVNADTSFTYHVFYDSPTEKAFGEFYNLTTGSGTVEHTITPSTSGTLTIQLLLGLSTAPNNVTISDVQVEVKDTPDSQYAPINRWAHEDYEASLSNTEDSATIAITKVPASGREAWKIKLFAETGAQLKAGSTYRVSLDVQAASKLGYEICYNNAEKEKDFGALYDLTASAGKETVTYTLTPEKDGVLTLQLNLGNAAAANEVTISGIRVEEVNFGAGTSVNPGFRYDSVGYIGKASDDGYVVSLEQHESSADFYIHHAPAERNPWNVKLNVRTGFTPVDGRGYRVSFDITAAKYQSLFEVFYDGKGEKDYGELYKQSLRAGKNTVSFIIPPTPTQGELTLQIRLGKTNGTDGNSYTISNITIDDAEFMSYTLPNVRAATELWTHADYTATLDKARDRATVRIEKTPAAGREAWKTKLFVHTGIMLMEGKKYRISMDVKSIIPAPFEICFNNGDTEKGLGAMYGLISTPSGQHVTYTTYPKQDTELVIQLSLGNCTPPNSIILSGLKVEKAGKINLVSDTIYTF